jgi:hypothetical protein
MIHCMDCKGSRHYAISDWLVAKHIHYTDKKKVFNLQLFNYNKVNPPGLMIEYQSHQILMIETSIFFNSFF